MVRQVVDGLKLGLIRTEIAVLQLVSGITLASRMNIMLLKNQVWG